MERVDYGTGGAQVVPHGSLDGAGILCRCTLFYEFMRLGEHVQGLGSLDHDVRIEVREGIDGAGGEVGRKHLVAQHLAVDFDVSACSAHQSIKAGLANAFGHDRQRPARA